MPISVPCRTTVGCPIWATVVGPNVVPMCKSPVGVFPDVAAHDGLMWVPIFCPHWLDVGMFAGYHFGLVHINFLLYTIQYDCISLQKQHCAALCSHLHCTLMRGADLIGYFTSPLNNVFIQNQKCICTTLCHVTTCADGYKDSKNIHINCMSYMCRLYALFLHVPRHHESTSLHLYKHCRWSKCLLHFTHCRCNAVCVNSWFLI